MQRIGYNVTVESCRVDVRLIRLPVVRQESSSIEIDRERCEMEEKINLLGAITIVAYFLSMILIFVFRLLGKPEYGVWLGFVQTVIALPLVGYLLFTARQLERNNAEHDDALDGHSAGAS